MLLHACGAMWNIAAIPTPSGPPRRVGYHEGYHHHPPPPLGCTPSRHISAAAAIWSTTPSLRPAEALAGNYTFDPSHPAHRPSVAEIDLKFTKSRQISILRDKALASVGIPREITHAGQSAHLVALDNLAKFAKSSNGFLGEIILRNGAISLPLQTASMRAWLNQPEESVKHARRIGRSGLATDGHNTFMTGAWILIQTVVFLDGPSRWFPVYMTIADGVTTEVYRRHFRGLLDSFDSSHSLDDIDSRFLHVADFHAAQGMGFQEAYTDFCLARAASVKTSSALTEPQTREEAIRRAASLIRGCERHLKASIIRAAARLSSDGSRETFIARLKSLFACTDAEQVGQRRSRFLHDFPQAQRWLDWWTRPRILRFIMRSDMARSPEDQSAIPTTSNAVEAAHKVLICGSGGEKFSLEIGLAKLATMIKEFENLELAASKPASTARLVCNFSG